jgi:DeoR family fructose operon transcriptional repressor
MYAEERQHEIVTRARELGRVSVAELATRFDVTPETIRRDLDALSGRGCSVACMGVPSRRRSCGSRRRPSTAARRASLRRSWPSRAARSSMLPRREGLTVIVDAGTTTGRLCSLLPAWVTSLAVTNSVSAAEVLAARGDLEVMMLGGQVRNLTQATVGEPALGVLRQLRVDVAFLGTNGISAEHGFSTPDPHEGAVKRAMVPARGTGLRAGGRVQDGQRVPRQVR